MLARLPTGMAPFDSSSSPDPPQAVLALFPCVTMCCSSGDGDQGLLQLLVLSAKRMLWALN